MLSLRPGSDRCTIPVSPAVASGLVVIVVRTVIVLDDSDVPAEGSQGGLRAVSSSTANGGDNMRAVWERSKSAPASVSCSDQGTLSHHVDIADGTGTGAGSSRMKRMLEFAVSDDGAGIAPHNRAKLFRAFMQIASDDGTKHVGQGLGLVISSRILQSLGGSIEIVDSEPVRSNAQQRPICTW